MISIYTGSQNEEIQVSIEDGGYCIINLRDNYNDSSEICIPVEDGLKIANEIIRVLEATKCK